MSRRSTDTEAKRPNVKKRTLRPLEKTRGNQAQGKKSRKTKGKAKNRGSAGGRRRREDENVRSLIRTSGGKSYAISLPREVIRAFRWEKRQKLELSVDSKRRRITISDWPRKK